ncbi:MAG: hypothetical protein AB1442_02750 [Nitrospirota bacterium]
MKIDIHCHVAGNGKDIGNADHDVFCYAEDNQHWFTRILYNLLETDLEKMEADLNRDGIIATNEYFELLYRLFSESREIDNIVLLALDAVFSTDTGRLDERKTDLWVSNSFLWKKVQELNSRLGKEADPAKRKKKFLFGASVSPNRLNWEPELDFVLNRTDAVLIKLIPSTQHIDLKDDRHRDFFRSLSQARMPLLCHVGPEYSFPEGIRNTRLDNFRNLEKLLESGVMVIAAHCASPVFPVVDRNVTKDFLAFMRSYNSSGDVRLWADISALSLSTRIPYIREIVDTFPPEWLVNGSDFPIPIDGWAHLPLVTHDVTAEEYISIYKTKNPFDRDVKIKRAHGFPDSILENGAKVLRRNVLNKYLKQ